jgi:hypothetical protein
MEGKMPLGIKWWSEYVSRQKAVVISAGNPSSSPGILFEPLVFGQMRFLQKVTDGVERLT